MTLPIAEDVLNFRIARAEAPPLPSAVQIAVQLSLCSSDYDSLSRFTLSDQVVERCSESFLRYICIFSLRFQSVPSITVLSYASLAILGGR